MHFHLKHKMAKFICGSMAVLLTVVGICVAMLSCSSDVYAKASLQSIEEIVAEAAQKNEDGEYVNPLTILEIVPDVVAPDNNTVRNAVGESTTIALVSDNKTIEFEQNMGTAGYYVKGEEAVTKDLEKYLSDHVVTVDGSVVHYKTTVMDYSARKELAQRMLTSIEGKSWVGSTNADETPIYKAGNYAEIRMGQFFPLGFVYDFNKNGEIESGERYQTANEELVEKLMQVNHYYPIFRDYTGKVYDPSGTKKDAFVDTAMGYMESVSMGEGSYVLSYEPKLNDAGKVDIDGDHAYRAVYDGSSAAFKQNKLVDGDELNGEFDPYLIHTTNNATHRATFAYVEGAASGYRITNSPSAVTDLSDIDKGTPLYVYDTSINQYVFAGVVGEEDGIRCVITQGYEELIGLYFKKDVGSTQSMYPLKIEGTVEESTEQETVEETITEETTEELTTEETTTEETTTEVATDTEEETASGEVVTEEESEDISTEEDSEDDDEEKEASEDEVSEEAGEEIEVADSNSTVKLTENEIYVPLEKCFSSLAENTAKEEDEVKILVEDGYYVLEFEYIENGDGVSGLYQVSSYDYDNDNEEGVPGAQYCVAVETVAGEPLPAIIPNEKKTGTVSLADYEAVKSQMIYDYKEDGGYYRFIGENWCSDSGYAVDSYSIRGAQIYFTTGIENNDWFKQHVLDRTPEQCADVAVEVVTLPAGKVTVEDIESSDMLLLNQCDETVCLVGEKKNNYCRDDEGAYDLSEAVCNRILEKVVTESYPVVSDYGILGEKAQELLVTGTDPNIFYLLKALTLDESKNSLSTYYNNYLMLNATNLTAVDPTELYSNLTANNFNFVNANLYTFCDVNDSTSPFAGMCYINEKFNTAIEDDVIIADGFEDVLLDIQNENIYRKTAGLEETISETVSQATTIRYILGYSARRAFETKGSLSILEIEPCASYSLAVEHVYTDADKTDVETATIKENKKTLITLDNAKVALTQMTTAEFIGRIEDINSHYDLIYIGDNVGLMNRDSSNKTLYNDERMNGMIYSNVGDSFVGKASELNGLITDPKKSTVSCRFPGNDVTEEKYIDLCEYVEAGYPVIIADGLMKTDDNQKLSVDKTTVDCNSYLYKFLDKYKGKENVFLVSSASESLLSMYVNLSRPVIDLTKNVSDEGELTDWYRATQEVVELQPGADGFYRAEYEFKIENKGIAASNTTFDCKLYVDINSDGKYSFVTEEITDIYVADDNGNEMLKDKEGRYHLKTGKTYDVTYTLAKTFHGVIPWRLRVTQNDEIQLRRADVTGYYVVNREKDTKISVLQIDTRDSKNSTWNMENSVATNSKTVFKALLEDKTFVPYDVDIQTILASKLTVKDTENKFGVGKGITDTDKNGSISIAEYLTFFRKFDMLVLGYADCYQAPSDTNVLEAVKIYAREGRSVLFTHDTSSFYNAGNNWGVEYNKILRNLFGMDRYNIMGERAESDDDTFEIESAYIPGSTTREKAKEIQGYNYFSLLYRPAGNNKYSMLQKLKKDYSGSFKTKKVQELNQGQITMYPYKLDGGEFDIAETHAQYYQLDFSLDEDRDGESDIVVWYTLAGNDVYKHSPKDARNNYYIYNKGNITYSGVGHSKVCTAEVKYDKNGNAIIEAGTKELNEVKLFINTLIAAYESGLHNPKVDVIEGYNENSRSINSLYVSYDDQLKYVTDERIVGGVVDGVKDIYFKTESASLVRVDSNTIHDFSVRFYVEVPEETVGAKQLTVDDSVVYAKEIEIGTSDGTTEGTYDNRLYYQITDGENTTEVLADKIDGKYQLKSGVVYRTSIPISALTDYNNFIFKEELSDEVAEIEEEIVGRNTRRIFIEATETVVNTQSDITTSASATDVVSVVRVQLFDLD